ncbi:MAG: TIGR03936 family radical SAM-associated protein [Anaerohalosphaeraceae bacterium]|nr:TIGR03936 family radical SAM-associated protein [Anaerohalosphaeraceae bacterium]
MSGNLKFLSHQETVKVIGTALLRAGINQVYSEGFNPRPRLSLPLPRTVGIESQDDIFSVQIFAEPNKLDKRKQSSDFTESIGRQLPDGCRLSSVEIYDGKAGFAATGVSYEFSVKGEFKDLLKSKVAELCDRLGSGEDIVLERITDAKGRTKKVNVGNYIESVNCSGCVVLSQCRITPGGTVRPDEIIWLLGIEPEMMDSAIVRKNVQWQIKN